MKTVRNITALLGVVALSLSVYAAPALASSPVFNTYNASSITSASAVLNGSYIANSNTSTNVYFEYGTTNALGSTTSGVLMSSPSSSYSATLTGLSPNTTYFYRALGANSTTGLGLGTIVTFTTTGNSLSTVNTYNASNITSTSATLSGAYSGSNTGTTYAWFEYANNASLIGSTSTTQTPQSGSYGSISQTVYGLQPNTTYWYRAMAQNNGNTAYGTPIISFTTSSGSTSGSVCSINTFYPANNMYSVQSGSSTTLYWTTSNCSYVSISSIGSVAQSGNTLTGAVYGPTTFVLSATGTNGTVTSSVALTTNGTNNNQYCSINSFTPSNNIYTVPSGSSTTLSWSTSNCSNVSITNIGSVAQSGSTTTGAIYGQMTYTLSASGYYGSDSRQVILTTNGTNYNGNSGYCQITGFAANDPSLTSGGTTNLYYTTSGCTSVTLSGGPSNNSYLSLSGTIPVGPLYSTTTYTLTAYGSNTDSRTVTISIGNFFTNIWNNVFGSSDQQTYYPPTQTVVSGEPIIQYVDGGTTTTSNLSFAGGSASMNGVEWGNHFPGGAVAVNNPNSVLGASVIGAGFLGMSFSGWIILILIIILVIVIARLFSRRY